MSFSNSSSDNQPSVPVPAKRQVIKLTLESEKDGPFVRIPVPQMFGRPFVETLIGRAMDLWAIKNDTSRFQLDETKVTLIYVDCEDDLCLILSDEDMRCALPVFPETLRVLARVEVPAKPPTSPQRVPPIISTSTQTTATHGPSPAPSATSSSSTSPAISDLPVHKVVESIVGILAAAAVALQSNVKVQHSTVSSILAAAAVALQSNVKVQHSTVSSILAATALSLQKLEKVDQLNVASSSVPITPTTPTVVSTPAAVSTGPVEEAVVVPVAVAPPAEEKPVENESNDPVPERPFIHGRHTCDVCLTTPILGKRFHAVNLPDYDLCSGCHANYKGNEIIFQEAQLGRDTKLQEAWNRRFNKFCRIKKQEKTTDKKLDKGEKNFKEERKAERKQDRQRARHSYLSKVAPTDQPKENPAFPLYGIRSVPDPWESSSGPCHAFQWNHTGEEQMDAAMKEALRRSMLDLEVTLLKGDAVNQDSETSSTSPSQEPPTTEVAATSPKDGVAPAKEFAVGETVTDAPEKLVVSPAQKSCPSEDVAVECADVKPAPEGASVKSPQSPSGDAKPVPGESTIDEAKEAALAYPEPEFEIPPLAPVGAPPAPRPAQESELKQAVADNFAEKASSPLEESPQEESFAEDAIGNGAVAEELGKAVDDFFNSINEAFKPDIGNVQVERVAESLVSDQIFSSIASGGASKEGGATILQGEEEEEDDDESESGSQQSWNFVDVMSDEALARATQVVGSALFESDLTRAESRNSESQSGLSAAGDSISCPSSCPSSLPSVVSGSVQPVQLERWVLQLTQLHELGFFDDAKNVEILERLHAANIGSDEMEEVSVERVVNEIMKDF